MLCRRLKALGIGNVNPSNVRLTTLLGAGATPEEFVASVPKALSAKDPFAYLLGIVEGERIRAAQLMRQVHHGPMPSQPQSAFAERRQRQLAVAGALTGKPMPAPPPVQPVEVIDAETRLLP
ncbi:hypothetical protein CS062_16305 [Roseateles chitinivorans]|uniref:Uncharacterized protein n=1 Tax=Roseateles chitinivorans TaxID=2917965 RepID=A0A2G9C6Y2_9BURK|nr:hypothetical protein [Roseateles chitinivorans]PIM52115.1 hypothetical protein CS062_16305 [Roseateles chitinivorans]